MPDCISSRMMLIGYLHSNYRIIFLFFIYLGWLMILNFLLFLSFTHFLFVLPFIITVVILLEQLELILGLDLCCLYCIMWSGLSKSSSIIEVQGLYLLIFWNFEDLCSGDNMHILPDLTSFCRQKIFIFHFLCLLKYF